MAQTKRLRRLAQRGSRPTTRQPCRHIAALVAAASLLAGTPFTAMLLLADGESRRQDGSAAQLYRSFPLYTQERELELATDAGELLRRFDKQGIGFTVDTRRPNVAAVR